MIFMVVNPIYENAVLVPGVTIEGAQDATGFDQFFYEHSNLVAAGKGRVMYKPAITAVFVIEWIIHNMCFDRIQMNITADFKKVALVLDVLCLRLQSLSQQTCENGLSSDRDCGF